MYVCMYVCIYVCIPSLRFAPWLDTMVSTLLEAARPKVLAMQDFVNRLPEHKENELRFH